MSTKTEVTFAALSIALSTALQVSGLGGSLVNVIAWTAVAMLLASLIFQHIRKVKGAGSMTDLGHRTWQLGHDLVNFKRSRKAFTPKWTKPRLWIGPSSSKREYEADTMSIFSQRFERVLHKVVDELRIMGLVGVSEALTLKAPKSSGAIELVGQRLIQLGSQMQSA